jgi:hypothetical protein
VIPGLQELLDRTDFDAERSGWTASPSVASIARCRTEALAADDGSGWPAIEAAALFYAFARNEWRLGNEAARKLPISMALYQMHGGGLMLRLDDLPGLQDLQDHVAEGSATWARVRAWFLEHAVPQGGA